MFKRCSMPNWSVPKRMYRARIYRYVKTKVGDYYHYSEQVFISEEKLKECLSLSGSRSISTNEQGFEGRGI